MGRLSTVPARLSSAPAKLASLQGSGWRQGKTGSTARGYSYRWQQYRIRFLVQHPLCVMCEAEGRTTAATVVDHIVPHRGDDKLFWDANNHQALCKPHHDGAKQREEAQHRI